MKKSINSSLRLLAVSAVAVFFASCGSVNQNDFTRAKYYNFGRHDRDVSIGKPVTNPANEAANKNVAATEQVKTDASNSNVNTSAVTVSKVQNSSKVMVPQKKAKNNNLAQKIAATVLSKSEFKNSESQIKPVLSVSPDEIQNSNATEGEHSIPLIVIIIIAIIVPPLAVYLHDDLIKNHFWWILILWLLGGGLALGLAAGYSAFGILWLIAAIWAILIVTGSAGSV